MPNEQENTEPTALDPNDALNAQPLTPPTPSSDPADEIPVPIAMSAAEIDERAQAVEAVRGTPSRPTNADTTNVTDPETRFEI